MNKNKSEYYEKQAKHLVQGIIEEVKKEYIKDDEYMVDASGHNSVYWEIYYKGQKLNDVTGVIRKK